MVIKPPENGNPYDLSADSITVPFKPGFGPDSSTEAPQEQTGIFVARPVDHEMNSDYGIRDLKSSPFHVANDYLTPMGTPVYAKADATVTAVYHDLGKAGNTVTLDYGGGVTQSFLHLSDDIAVKEGDTVSPGDLIAKTGNSGVGTIHLDSRIALKQTLPSGETISIFVDPQKVHGEKPLEGIENSGNGQPLNLADPSIREALVNDAVLIAKNDGFGRDKNNDKIPDKIAVRTLGQPESDLGDIPGQIAITSQDDVPSEVAALTLGKPVSNPGQTYKQVKVQEVEGDTAEERLMRRTMMDQDYAQLMESNPVLFFFALIMEMFGPNGNGGDLTKAFKSVGLNNFVRERTGIENPARAAAGLSSPNIASIKNVSIGEQQQEVAAAIPKAAAATGVSPEFMKGLWGFESSFGKNQMSPTGCEGHFQFSQGTWDNIMKNYGDEIARDLASDGYNEKAQKVAQLHNSKGSLNAYQYDTAVATYAAAYLIKENAKTLGVDPMDQKTWGVQYAAYNIGPGNAKKLLNAQESGSNIGASIGKVAQQNPYFFKGGASASTALARYQGVIEQRNQDYYTNGLNKFEPGYEQPQLAKAEPEKNLDLPEARTGATADSSKNGNSISAHDVSPVLPDSIKEALDIVNNGNIKVAASLTEAFGNGAGTDEVAKAAQKPNNEKSLSLVFGDGKGTDEIAKAKAEADALAEEQELATKNMQTPGQNAATSAQTAKI